MKKPVRVRVKGAFTLIEIMIVILLIAIVSYLTFSSFSAPKSSKEKIKLETLKKQLIKYYPFEKSLKLVCIEEENLPCYIFVDGNLKEEKIENLFETVPEVYNYDEDLTTVEFYKVRIGEIEYEPFFELEIQKDYRNKNLILDTMDNKVYLIKAIKNEFEVYESTNEILEKLNELKTEVRDAL